MLDAIKPKTWLKKIVVAIIAIEIGYVVLMNLALQLPLTQTLINQIKPEKFHVAWDSAWTWYPFRIHIKGGSADGQSRRQQWAFEVESLTASIDVFPLIFKRVWIDDVIASNISYFQRPRQKSNNNETVSFADFPPIGNREVSMEITTALKKKRPWHVDIEGIELSGKYHYWIKEFQGSAEGKLEGELSVVSRGGLFSMELAKVELELDKHTFGADHEVFQQGTLSGRFGFLPFVPRQSKGINLLRHNLVDMDVDIKTSTLEFINLFTAKSDAIGFSGTGGVSGHLNMEHGHILEGTDLRVDAKDLLVDLLSFDIAGDGVVSIQVGQQTDQLLDLDVDFNGIEITQGDESKLVLSGQGLVLDATTDNNLFPDELLPGSEKWSFAIDLKIPDVHLEDISLFNRFFPDHSPLQLNSGVANLDIDLLIDQDSAEGGIVLNAESIKVVVNDQPITADFNANIVLAGGILSEMLFDISGSEFKLQNVKVIGEGEEFNQDDWAAALTFIVAETGFADPLSFTSEADLSMTDSRPIVAMMGDEKPRWMRSILKTDSVNGTIQIHADSEKVVIPYAYITSEKIDFGAKGVFASTRNDGVVFMRYRKLEAVIKYSKGDQKIQLFGAKETFEKYVPPITELPTMAHSEKLEVPDLDDKDYEWIAGRIFQNETGGQKQFLTYWGEGEDFPSFGIGHFIWFPVNVDAPFDETFPAMVAYVAGHTAYKASLPDWMHNLQPFDAPWNTKQDFDRMLGSSETTKLLTWLEQTSSLQARFIVNAFENRWQTLDLPAEQKHRLTELLRQLLGTAKGLFAVIDYYNFKGLGNNLRERYQGEGWGLVQVLEGMPPQQNSDPELVTLFSQSAANRLSLRVKLSPPERNEQRWLEGWLKRLDGYL